LAMNKWFDFIDVVYYEKILMPLLLLSKLGRSSVLGQADSGLNFDHMYMNKPKGVTAFGKFVDRVLLNLPSVQATRARQEIIVKILQNEILNNVALQQKSRIVDIASGPARYLSDFLNNYGQNSMEVLCIDRDRRSLNFGKILARNKPMRFIKADIFRTNKLQKLSSRSRWIPNVVICSGLFEYLEDTGVKKILSDIFKNLDDGGLLVFASQKDNPSKKLMSRVCKTQNGNTWDLFYRNPELFRAWLLNAGFRAAIVSVDRWGMYEFCTARKYL